MKLKLLIEYVKMSFPFVGHGYFLQIVIDKQILVIPFDEVSSQDETFVLHDDNPKEFFNILIEITSCSYVNFCQQTENEAIILKSGSMDNFMLMQGTSRSDCWNIDGIGTISFNITSFHHD